MKKTFILYLVTLSTLIYAAVPTGKVPMTQITGLSDALNAKLSLSTADTRYNKVSDNINPWQYLYRKTQTDSLFLNVDPNHADPNQNIYGNINMTDGSLVLDNGEIYASSHLGSGGRVRAFNEFRAGSNKISLTVNDGGTHAMSLVQSNIGTDIKPAIFSTMGNSTENAVVVTSDDSRLPFTRYTLASQQTQISLGFPDNNTIVPLGGFDITNSTNTKHLFTVWNDGRVKAYNLISDMQSIVSAAGNTTLTNGSPRYTTITGTTTQTITLPDATSLLVGQSFKFFNNSTGLVTVQNSAATTLWSLAAGTFAEFSVSDIGTAAGVWAIDNNSTGVSSGKKLSVNNSLTLTGTDGTNMIFPSYTTYVASNPCTTIGDMIVANSTGTPSNLSRLPAVATGQVLVSTGVGTAPAWSGSPTVTTQSQTDNTTKVATTAFVRLYTQPIAATATTLTAGNTVTWTPVFGTNRYTLTPAQAEVINMGTIPSTLVGTELTLVITTSGTTSYAVSAGTNLKMQGALNTGTVTAITFVLKFLVLSTTSVVEVSRTIAM